MAIPTRRSASAFVALLSAISVYLAGAPTPVAALPDPGMTARPVAQGPLATPPNVVILLIDDFPALGDRVFQRLPNIKATFLDQGVSFENYWANFSLCCPGRATLLTGQRADHTGVTRNLSTLFDPSETLATELQGIGYHTMIFGKYLNQTSKLVSKTPPGWDDVVIKDSGPYFKYPMWINGVREWHGTDPDDYSTDVVANASMPFIDNAPADQPLFMYLAPDATHGGQDEDGLKDSKQPVVAPAYRGDPRCADIPPWDPASYNEADVSDKPAYLRKLPLLTMTDGWPLEKSCEALLSVDDWFGRIVTDLKAQGRYDNTLFILAPDNGMGWGANRILGKVAPETAQMPLYISWPAVNRPTPRSDSTLLSNIDIAPTICDIAGCEMGPFPNGYGVDGQSFAGLIDAPAFRSVPQRDSVIIEGGQSGTAVPPFQGLLTGANNPHGQWLFVKYLGQKAKELYDMSGGPCYSWQVGNPGDPCMMNNVANSKPSLRHELNLELIATW